MPDSDGSTDENAESSASEPLADSAEDSLPTESTTTAESQDAPAEAGSAEQGREQSAGGGASTGRRTIETPAGLVKIVVIFSTFIAISSVLIGFMFLDAATRVLENPPASLFVGFVKFVTGMSNATVEPYLTPIAMTVGLLGLLFIGLGAWVYAIGTRFRTEDGNA